MARFFSFFLFLVLFNDTVIQGKECKTFFEDYEGRRIYADSEENVFYEYPGKPPVEILSGSWIRLMGPHVQFKVQADDFISISMTDIQLWVDDNEHVDIISFPFKREAEIVAEELNRHVQRMIESATVVCTDEQEEDIIYEMGQAIDPVRVAAGLKALGVIYLFLSFILPNPLFFSIL